MMQSSSFVNDSIRAQLKDLQKLLSPCENKISALSKAAKKIASSQEKGGKLLIFGNGGSAAQAQHISAELVGRFLRERIPLKAMALTCDTSILTAVSNDYGFDDVFARQIRALATPIDVVLGISTSGGSANVLKALQASRDIGAYNIMMAGFKKIDFKIVDLLIDTPETSTPRIQELHLVYSHIICGLLDDFLFNDNFKEFR